MAVDWIGFHGLKGDPFNLAPLQTESDFRHQFVKTEDQVTFIDPLLRHFSDSAANVVAIGGARGVGKSTTLHYMLNQLNMKNTHEDSLGGGVSVHGPPSNLLTAYVQLGIEEKQYRDTQYGIGYGFLYAIVSELVSALRVGNKPVWVDFKEKLEEIAAAVGQPSETPVKQKAVTYGGLSRRLAQLCEILAENSIRSFVAIDNFDKQPDEAALDFLRKGFSQPVFETLVGGKVTTAITISEDWLNKIEKDPDFSYLGKPVYLNPFTPEDCQILVAKRLRPMIAFGSKDKDPTKEDDRTINARYFDSKCLPFLTISSRGIPRKVIELARECLVTTAQADQKLVTIQIAQAVYKDERKQLSEVYAIIEKHLGALDGFRTITDIQESVDYNEFRRLIATSKLVYQKASIDRINADLARSRGLVTLIPSVRAEDYPYSLVPEVRPLYAVLDKEKKLDQFVSWITREKASTLQIATPEENRKRGEIKELIKKLVDLQDDERVRELLVAIDSTISALERDFEEQDYDSRLVSRRAFDLLWTGALLAFLLSKPTTEATSLAVPSYEEVREFVVRTLPTEAADWASTIEFCRVSSQVIGLNPDPIKSRTKAEKHLLGFLKVSYTRTLESPSRRAKEVVTSSIDEVAIRVKAAVERGGFEHFLIRFESVGSSDFAILGWASNDGFRAHRYGRVISRVDKMMDRFTWEGLRSTPEEIITEYGQLMEKLPYRYTLAIYNGNELGRLMGTLTRAAGALVAEIHNEKETVRINLSIRKNQFVFQATSGPPAHR